MTTCGLCFPPRIDVYTYTVEKDRVFHAVKSQYGDKSFDLKCTAMARSLSAVLDIPASQCSTDC